MNADLSDHEHSGGHGMRLMAEMVKDSEQLVMLVQGAAVQDIA